MNHNKGKFLRFCEECKRKRFCERIPIPSYNFRYTCSKGHSWVIQGITVERVNAIYQDTFSKEKIESLFNRDDTFFKTLKK